MKIPKWFKKWIDKNWRFAGYTTGLRLMLWKAYQKGRRDERKKRKPSAPITLRGGTTLKEAMKKKYQWPLTLDPTGGDFVKNAK